MGSNEITLKIKCNMKEFICNLKEKGYKMTKHFILNDTFLIPNVLDVENLSTREIIANSIIIRKVNDITGDEIRQDISFKEKKINSNGEIIEQKSTRLKIFDINEAEVFFTAIGYKKILNIVEEDFTFEKNGKFKKTKSIENGDNMIEVETQEEYDTINKLKSWIISEEFNLDYSNYFVKKAEIELNKVLKKQRL